MPILLGSRRPFWNSSRSIHSGGDKTAAHNCVRNDLHIHAKKGQANPRLEAGGLLNTLGIPDGATDNRERPADVLLCQAQDSHTGVNGSGNARVALDVGIVCPQAAGHRVSAAEETLGAAESYVRTKCSNRDMELRCRAAGVVFQPMIFESMGGISAEVERVIKCLNKSVASNTDSPLGEVATHFWRRLSVDIQRFGHRALARRMGGPADEAPSIFSSLQWLQLPGGI